MKKDKLANIKKKIHQTRIKQVGNIRFTEDAYNKIAEIAEGFGVTKQWLIQQIVEDFIIDTNDK